MLEFALLTSVPVFVSYGMNVAALAAAAAEAPRGGLGDEHGAPVGHDARPRVQRLQEEVFLGGSVAGGHGAKAAPSSAVHDAPPDP